MSYQYFSDRMNFDDSVANCTSQGGFLAIPKVI